MCRLRLTIVSPWERCALAGADASPEQGQCATKMTHRPALGEAGPVRIRFSPEQGRCAAKMAHRPCSGEFLLLERGIGCISAQRLGLGEICLFGKRAGAAFLLVEESPFSPALPSRDLAPLYLSQARTLRRDRLYFRLESRSFSKARTLRART